MNEKKNIFYCVLFFVLCLIPLVGMILTGPSESAANEILPDCPLLIQETGEVNPQFLKELSDYIDNRFAFRQEMITANRKIHVALLNDSIEEDVILGKDGWLFYADTLYSYERLNNMTEYEIWCAAHNLSMIQDYCERRGVNFLFVAVPNKNTLYGQFMPKRFPCGKGDSELEALSNVLEKEAVQTVDLVSAFQKQNDILYRKQDSHWTSRGAGLAGDEILESLGQKHTPFYGGDYEAVYEEYGDLYEMLYPKGRRLDQDEQYTREFTFSYDDSFRTSEDVFIRTEQAGASGNLLMFRDSFGNALHPFLAEAFENATFSRQNPYDLGLIESEEADTVVIELVERNLRWLLERPAIFPAPEVDCLETENFADWSIQAEVTPAETLADYTMITGEIQGALPDKTSPVFVRCGSIWYEASLTGERTFAAYIPTINAEAFNGIAAFHEGNLYQCSIINYKEIGGNSYE